MFNTTCLNCRSKSTLVYYIIPSSDCFSSLYFYLFTIIYSFTAGSSAYYWLLRYVSSFFIRFISSNSLVIRPLLLEYASRAASAITLLNFTSSSSLDSNYFARSLIDYALFKNGYYIDFLVSAVYSNSLSF